MNDLIVFKEYARDAHSGQMYGDHPYMFHLDHVANVIGRFGFDEDVQKIAYLHDVLEDTNTSYSELFNAFGAKVARVVSAVTDDPSIKDRKGRKLETYPRIRESETATIVKLADRIANVECCWATDSSDKLMMYFHEHRGFRGGLYDAWESARMMEWYLDHLLNGWDET